jgi:hypothetical protein
MPTIPSLWNALYHLRSRSLGTSRVLVVYTQCRSTTSTCATGLQRRIVLQCGKRPVYTTFEQSSIYDGADEELLLIMGGVEGIQARLQAV